MTTSVKRKLKLLDLRMMRMRLLELLPQLGLLARCSKFKPLQRYQYYLYRPRLVFVSQNHFQVLRLLNKQLTFRKYPPVRFEAKDLLNAVKQRSLHHYECFTMLAHDGIQHSTCYPVRCICKKLSRHSLMMMTITWANSNCPKKSGNRLTLSRLFYCHLKR